MSPALFRLSGVVLLALLSGSLHSQVEVKGAGNTSATVTFQTKNSTPDTTFFVRDDGRVGIGTTSPQTKFDVNGVIYGRNGVQYPDGTIQVTGYTGTTNFAKCFVVATTGGNYTTINAALSACGVTGPSNRYIIVVMPGIYTESIVLKKYVTLRGAGKYSSVIDGSVITTDSCIIEGFHIKKGIQCGATSPTILNNIISNSGSAGASAGIDIQNYGQPWIRGNEIISCASWGISSIGFYANGWFICNKIQKNNNGGIYLENSSPTISNNIIDSNQNFGIYMKGVLGAPTEPTISDNVILHTYPYTVGVGVYMIGKAEPRVMSNDIAVNAVGIHIDTATQPSIIGNNINYNKLAGIRCFSQGSSKRVMITSNVLHSNVQTASGTQLAGIYVLNCNPLITQNHVTQNSFPSSMGMPDIDYSNSVPGPLTLPVLNSNTYDIIFRPVAPPTAGGNFNTDSNGAMIGP